MTTKPYADEYDVDPADEAARLLALLVAATKRELDLLDERDELVDALRTVTCFECGCDFEARRPGSRLCPDCRADLESTED